MNETSGTEPITTGTSATEPRLSLRAVPRSYGGGEGVHNIDLDVQPGEIHTLVGLNGAGKSTLMKLMIGMLRPDSGELRLLSQDSRSMSGDCWARVGALIEYPLAYGELDGAANLRLAARLHGVPPAAIPGVVGQVFGGIEPGALFGGPCAPNIVGQQAGARPGRCIAAPPGLGRAR